VLQLHVTKTLGSDLKTWLSPGSKDLRSMQWYGHRVHVSRRKCVILMEAHSRYAMILPGLKKADFECFPALVHERLWREVVTICNLDERGTERLAALVDRVVQPVQFLWGNDRSVQAHINEVALNLRWEAEGPDGLPETENDAFAFGLRMNRTPRSCKGESEFFYPLEVFQAFWLDFLEGLSRIQADRPSPQAVPDNVVPFRKRD
jgi:hypothetical protein